MGLVTGLLTLPLAPVRGVVWVAERVYEQAERQSDDSALIRRRLMEVQAAREAGTMSEAEAAEQEAVLFQRLWETRRGAGGGKV
jgi:Gas vesicle protein G